MNASEWERFKVVLATDWRTIAITTLVVTAAGAAYAFGAPSWYESELSVVPQASTKTGGLAAALTADLPIDVSLPGAETANAERIQAILKSRTVTDAVIAKFQLRERYSEKYIETTRKTLWTHCSVKLDKKPNVVTLTLRGQQDPTVAREMAGYFGEVGNVVSRNISATSAGEERRFLEQRWEQSKHDVEEASSRLRDFEEKHKLIDLSEQSKAMVSAMASLKAELLAKQIQLSYLNGFSSSDEATALQLRREVSVIESKLDSMFEARKGSEGADARVVPPSRAGAARNHRRLGAVPGGGRSYRN